MCIRDSFLHCTKFLKSPMIKLSTLISTAIFLCFNTLLFCQPRGINREKYRINTSETKSTITIDGIMDEPAWLTADKATHFQRVLPTDTGFAIAQTEVRVIYDESNIYVGIICWDSTPGKRPVESPVSYTHLTLPTKRIV